MYLMLLLIIMGGTSSAELIMIYDDNYEYTSFAIYASMIDRMWKKKRPMGAFFEKKLWMIKQGVRVWKPIITLNNDRHLYHN